MAQKVLISGGSGLIGGALTKRLLQEGYQVALLSRSLHEDKEAQYYVWDVEEGKIEAGALEDVRYVINLAGAPVADHRWTARYKQQLLKSRTASTELLVRELARLGVKPEAFIQASAIGYYGKDEGDSLLMEQDPAGEDFLAQICAAWEAAAQPLVKQGVRLAVLRIGVVLSPEGGALKQMLPPFKLGLGAPIGSGEQYMSWIHIDDLCGIVLQAMRQENMKGPYNAVAPKPVRMKEFSKTLAKVLDKPYFAPKVPAIAIKVAMGERASIVLGSIRVSAEKVEEAGYTFSFPKLELALEHLLK